MSDARSDDVPPRRAVRRARTERGFLPCPACSSPVAPQDGECPRCAEPLFRTACNDCGATVFVGHVTCLACAADTAPDRPEWAEGTPVPELVVHEASTPHTERTRVQFVPELAMRRYALRPSRGACPRCEGRLVQSPIAALDLDECHRCGGLFVVVTELARLVFDPAVALALMPRLLSKASSHPSRGGSLRGCPVCRGPLTLRALATASGRAAVCRQHGAWFEPSALAAAARELADGVLAGGERERAVFRHDIKNGRYDALVAHARALRGRAAPDDRGPLSILAELIG